MAEAFRTRRVVPRILALVIIACALLARVLIPQGWMPIETDHGWQITICTGTGPMKIEMPTGMASAITGVHHGSDHQDHGPNDHPCTYSSLALALNEPVLPALDLPRLAVEAWLPQFASAVSIGHGLAAPPPPSTGPPSIL